MAKLWEWLLYVFGLLSLVTIDLYMDYEEMGKMVLEVIKDQKVGNGAFLPFLVDNGFCMFGGENPIDDREQGVLVTVLFLVFLGSLYLLYPIFFDIWKTTKDEQVNFF